MDKAFESDPTSSYDLFLAESASERINLESEAIDLEIGEIDRRTGLMEELENTIDQEGDVSQHELDLISQATAALIGDLPGGTPSLESSTGTISLESFKAVANELGEAGKKLLAKLIKLISEFWENMGTRVGGVITGAKATRDRTREIVGMQPKERKFLVGIQATGNLTYKGSKVDKYPKLIEVLRDLESTMSVILSTWAVDVVESGGEVVKILNSALNHEDGEIEEALISANAITQQLLESVNPALTKEVHLPGGRSIHFNYQNPKDIRSQVNKARALQRSGLVMTTSENEVEGDMEFETMTGDQIRELMDVSLRICESIRRYRERNKLRSFGDQTLDMVRSAKIMSGNIENDVTDTRPGIGRAALYNYGNTYTSWCRQPTLPVVSVAITFCRIVQSLSNRAINTYL